MLWFQRTIQLPAFPRGFHLVTRQVTAAVPELRKIRIGILQAFLQHTSASLSINENADPDVRTDLERATNEIVSERFPYIHTIEGPDDMPAHVKSAFIGCSVSIPIENGQLALGTWQGIYLGEHRNHGGGRSIVVTAYGAE